MKDQALQIIQKLQAYHPDKVLEAFELYKNNLETSTEDLLEKALKKDGWIPQSEKPDVPHYFINENYWILSDAGRQRKIEEIKAGKFKAHTPAPKTSMGLKKVDILCPKCAAKMYKQNVCPKCKDGKNGFKIRLICEENPDHEFLL